MNKATKGFLTYMSVIILVSVPVLLVLKWFLGFHIPLISLKDKSLLYILAILWNVSFGYVLFKEL